jgi:beta-lactamase class A
MLSSPFAIVLGLVSVISANRLGADGAGAIPWLARMSEFGHRTTDGRFGFLLKPMGTGPAFELYADMPFEPASAIKVLVLFHALRSVEHGEADLIEPVRVLGRMHASCPEEGGTRHVPLREALRAMMQDSDNAATHALRERFGDDAILATAVDLGLHNTILRHRIGCAEGLDGAYENPNQTTLRDLAMLYERLNSSALTETSRALAWQVMNTSTGHALPAPLLHLVEQEASALPGTGRLVEPFLAQTRVSQKSGNYDWRVGEQEYHHECRAGLIWLPFKDARGEVRSTPHAVAAFVNDASDGEAASLTATTLFWECLRTRIRDALRSWSAAARLAPADLDNGRNDGVPDGEVDLHDLVYFIDRFREGDLAADVDDGTGDGTPDGEVTTDDLLFYLAMYQKYRDRE